MYWSNLEIKITFLIRLQVLLLNMVWTSQNPCYRNLQQDQYRVPQEQNTYYFLVQHTNVT